MSDQIRTTEELDQLKNNWAKDPCWDIEDTEGFEAHREELKAWREERDAKLDAEFNAREEARANLVREQTGVVDADIVVSLFTWKEIEMDLYRAEPHGDATAIALVRATLLQAAQLKRIADVLERMEDGDTLSNSVKIWGSGQ